MNPLAVDVGGITLENPVMPASGTFEYDPAVVLPFDVNRLGAIVPKSVTWYPQRGNRPSRLAETPAGLINSIGIPSPGIEKFLQYVLPRYAHLVPPVIVSVAGYSPEDYARLTAEISRVPFVAGIELNLSCPNIQLHRMPAQDPVLLHESVSAARTATKKPLWAKLSLEVTSIIRMAEICQKAGANAVTLINTVRALALNPKHQHLLLGNATGGLSGPAIRPMALAAVWEVTHALNIPVIGVGGIVTTEDALMFLMAGARAIQVGTASFRQPLTMIRIIDGLENHLRRERLSSLYDVIGAAKRYPAEQEAGR